MIRKAMLALFLSVATGVALAGCSPQTKTGNTQSIQSSLAAAETTYKDFARADAKDSVVIESDKNASVTVNGKTTRAKASRSMTMINGTFLVDGKPVAVPEIPASVNPASPGTVTYAIRQHVAVNRARHLHIQAHYGNIVVLPSHDGVVTVTATVVLGDTRLTAAERKKYVANFALHIDWDAGVILSPHVTPPRNFPKGMCYSVSYTVTVPPTLALDLASENGAITVKETRTTEHILARNLFGPIRISHAGSNISAINQSGSVTITCDPATQYVDAHTEFGAISVVGDVRMIDALSESGDITVADASHAESVSANSDFGRVSVQNCAGDISALSEERNVSFSGIPTKLELASTFGAVDAAIASTRKLTQANIHSDHGAIQTTLPKDASLALDVQTEKGNIQLTGAPGAVITDGGKRTYRQNINGGKVPIQIAAADGTVHIRLH